MTKNPTSARLPEGFLHDLPERLLQELPDKILRDLIHMPEAARRMLLSELEGLDTLHWTLPPGESDLDFDRRILSERP
ncbi:MAG: hypothetical protein CMH57_09550 [Myxococcales bacterium]|nr:hypothetical protein [Myxococcales bacterium]